MTYYLVKLKPDCRWLDAHGYWDISRDTADRFGSRRAANEAALGCDQKCYEDGDIVIVRVRTVKRKVIPVPKVSVMTGPSEGFEVRINDVTVRDHIETIGHAHAAAGLIRRALGIEETT